MRNKVATLSLTLVCIAAHAIDGHNGVRFTMNQGQVEKLGFICTKVDDDPTMRTVARCMHMDMKGAAFNTPTSNYIVSISTDGKVGSIASSFTEIRTREDYSTLLNAVGIFFPKKDLYETQHLPELGHMRDSWRTPNNAGISIIYATGSKGYSKDSFRVAFFSPNWMRETDKKRIAKTSETDTAK